MKDAVFTEGGPSWESEGETCLWEEAVSCERQPFAAELRFSFIMIIVSASENLSF